MSFCPARVEQKAMREPSGDQRPSKSSAGWSVIRVHAEVRRSNDQRSHCPARFEQATKRLPSGASVASPPPAGSVATRRRENAASPAPPDGGGEAGPSAATAAPQTSRALSQTGMPVELLRTAHRVESSRRPPRLSAEAAVTPR